MMDFALLVSAFGFGIRHGFDWDHIAAISGIATGEKNPRRAFSLATAYPFGHAAVVILLGVGIILADFKIPDSVDTTMMYVIGGSLIGLGLWVLVNVVIQGEDFQLRSRWMIMRDGAFRGLQQVRRSSTGRSIVVEHEHAHLHPENKEVHDHNSTATDMRFMSKVQSLINHQLVESGYFMALGWKLLRRSLYLSLLHKLQEKWGDY